MKTCPKCNKDHGKKGAFCSRSCANSRTWSEEQNRKRGLSLKGKTWTAEKREKNIVTVQAAKTKQSKTWLEKYKDTPFENLGSANRRRRVLEEQNYKCNTCGIGDWQGKHIELQLEHKDGWKTNNARKNLEALCPNCHSQTSTWCGKSKDRVGSAGKKYHKLP